VLIAVAGATEVVVYTSVDDVFARPLAEKFQKDTDIEVKLVPDTEETKSTGLLNRLIGEKKRPVADVFLSGDPMRAAVPKARGISAPYKSPNLAGMPPQFSKLAKGRALVLVTLHPTEAMALCQTALVLENGTALDHGSMRNLLTQPQSRLLRLFGEHWKKWEYYELDGRWFI
jgi:hypothetical protein